MGGLPGLASGQRPGGSFPERGVAVFAGGGGVLWPGRYPATLQLVNRVLNTHQAFLSEKMPFAQWLRHKGTAPAVV